MTRASLFLLVALFPLGTLAEQLFLLPQPGVVHVESVASNLLELTIITRDASIGKFQPVSDNGKLELPPVTEFSVRASNQLVPIASIGFKRRVLYAPLKDKDLRVANTFYLTLSNQIPDGQNIEVTNPKGKLWPDGKVIKTTTDPFRLNSSIHINQVGYIPSAPKRAMIGYYLGNYGELKIKTDGNTNCIFKLIEVPTRKTVFEGKLLPRPDRGFPYSSYQQVLEADFSAFSTPGEYQLFVPGMGTSHPFFINDGVAAILARTYALGLYHQRCGTDNAMPFTRHTHADCHVDTVDVASPQSTFAYTWGVIAQESGNAKNDPRHTAPQLKDEGSQLYPFVKKGKIEVSGGHHDAGDYSKYTINSASLVHHLMFAVDSFPGVAALDNLGLPESGDGISDILQEAKWEADFLAKMQDTDGGFYFLVYPRDRRYENNVTPDKGDAQLVWPKNTAVTAAAVAALAQCASSPKFKQHYPQEAALYLQKAKLGWTFLINAINRYGKDGSYQKITHYGNEFMHDDELAWAAAELFLATGERAYEKELMAWCNPADGQSRKWGWLRMFEGYGCAIRSYVMGVKSGRLKPNEPDPEFLLKCENELIAASNEQLQRSEDSAYGTSFPQESKRARTAGWYFSGDAAFDLIAAMQLDYPKRNDPRQKFLNAAIANLNYEAGCNPVNVSYITGLGWKQQREIVHQYAQNDRRVFPPSGIPIGNIQGGFGWLDHYKELLGKLTFPADDSSLAPYPFYDRWGDSFNLSTEFVIVNQARSLAVASYLMAQTPLKSQPWKAISAQINVVKSPKPEATLKIDNIDLKQARIVWECEGREPSSGAVLTLTGGKPPSWIEAEGWLPDGRRFAAVFPSPEGKIHPPNQKK